LRINNKNAEKIVWLTYTEGAGGYFSLSNENVETIRLSSSYEGGRLNIYNRGNTRISFLGAMDNQDGNLSIYNNYGTFTGSIPNY